MSSNPPEEISISPEFYEVLKQYTNSSDPLEDPNFDIASYLNEKFPDFKSLEKLPNLIEQFEKQITELDEEIDGLMCERATYNDELKLYMGELNNDVGKIIDLINTIKQNSDTNESTVKLICNDIKNLDNARNNITTTISSLTKLIIAVSPIALIARQASYNLSELLGNNSILFLNSSNINPNNIEHKESFF